MFMAMIPGACAKKSKQIYNLQKIERFCNKLVSFLFSVTNCHGQTHQLITKSENFEYVMFL
jgi:hypothetical protein